LQEYFEEEPKTGTLQHSALNLVATQDVNSRAMNNAESVREFQPRVCFETLGSRRCNRFFATLKELRCFAVDESRHNSFRVASSKINASFPRLPKRNPGLELANAFSVIRRTLSFSNSL
jgi:hypothetical protein